MKKRNIKIGNKNVCFNYSGLLKAQEVVAIESYIKGAYELTQNEKPVYSTRVKVEVNKETASKAK